MATKTTTGTKSTKATKTTTGTKGKGGKAKDRAADAAIAKLDTMSDEQQQTALEQGLPETPKAEAKAPKAIPTAAEALAKAKHENPARYSHVEAVTEQTPKGEPKRVLIRCSDPQTKQGATGQQESVCEGTRDIAVQDLFQVVCCAACADRKVRKARRNRAKVRNKAARKLLQAREGR